METKTKKEQKDNKYRICGGRTTPQGYQGFKKSGSRDIEEIQDIRNLIEIGLSPKIIGVNNRNLRNLEISLNTSKTIIPKLKDEFGDEFVVISESGINSFEDIKFLLSYKADGFLIGSSIMKSPNIKEKILELRGEL